jgi:hypothetical protein
MNEYSYWDTAQFITLSYDSKAVPKGYNLRHSDVQKMFKSLRQKIGTQRRLKYFLCGEYGDKKGRPHYHMILYGLSTEECVKYFSTETRKRPDIKRELVWKHGFVYIGYNVTAQTCAYVAQYTAKKLRRKDYDGHRVSPYLVCSKGIGKRYAEDKRHDYLKKGYIAFGDNKYPIPRYYFKVLDLDRGQYYKNYIDKALERLVRRAEAERVRVFMVHTVPKYLTTQGQMATLRRKLELDYEQGRIMCYQGEWRSVTKQFLKWCHRLAVNKNLMIRHKWRDKRNKL